MFVMLQGHCKLSKKIFAHIIFQVPLAVHQVVVFGLQLADLFLQLPYPLSLLSSTFLELLPLLLDVSSELVDGILVDILPLLDLLVQVIPLLLVSLGLLLLVVHLRLVLGDLCMQPAVLLLEALYPLIQLLAALITLVHLLREALELLDGLLGLSAQHEPEFFSLAGKFLDLLLEASETHLLGL